jgi:hypothetical protein
MEERDVILLPVDLTVEGLIEELKKYDPKCRVLVVKSWSFNKSHKYSQNRIIETHQVQDLVILELAGYAHRAYRKAKDPLDELMEKEVAPVHNAKRG